jgi:CubicO group peptidase (beta-lactamase class C family)
MKILAMVLLWATTATAAAPTVTIPDTPEGRQIKALLDALAKPEAAALKQFVEGHFAASALAQTPVETRVERIRGMADRMGPIELLRVPAARDGRAELVARARNSGDILTITLDLEPGGDKRIKGLSVEAEPGGAGGGGGRSGSNEPKEAPKGSDAEVAAAADQWLSQLSAKDEFSGVVLLARNGVPFFQHACGLADRARGVPNAVDTRFNVGSIGKAFTSATIAKLIREGRLADTDTIRKVLPGSKIPSADRITVRQLLDMSSGLGDTFGPEFAANPHRLRELSDYLTLFETKPLRFEPGAKREYSNAGYVVLGLMIEKLTGKKYRDAVQEAVFGPAGMSDTGFFQVDEATPRRAIGYTRHEEVRSHAEASKAPAAGAPGGKPELQPNTDLLPGRGSSAGGSFSTAADLLKFAGAFAKGTIDLARDGDAPRGQLAIAGGTAGCNAVLESEPEKGFTVIVLVNEDPPLAEKTGRKLRQWLNR